ncbi:chromate resistance protein ChrB domain-containing protein [Nonomuraea sp. NPDC005983]|uniref:chromate resistance protein ChrB domain-containing protein n=1 Tax=Nonomuraea sp. NPDC005983 TaxID=3155595 RepID=UPI0033A93785
MTRARPETDRIACPWLIRRFIDPDAEIRYASRDQRPAARRSTFDERSALLWRSSAWSGSVPTSRTPSGSTTPSIRSA